MSDINIKNMEENFFDGEIEKKLLALTKASFRVSDLISDLILREKIKHQTLDVYKKFFTKNNRDLLSELDVLDKMFYLAGHLNLAKEEYVKSLRNGFMVFKAHIVLVNHQPQKYADSTEATERNRNKLSEVLDGKVKIKSQQETTDGELSGRQSKIMNYFKDKKEVKFIDLLKLFPNFSDKTIRNDLVYLIKLEKLKRLEKGTYGWR